MNAPSSNETPSARLGAQFREARAIYEQARDGLTEVAELVRQSSLTIECSIELIGRIEAAKIGPRFSEANRCGQEIAYSLGARSIEALPRKDQRVISCVCAELDAIATWRGAYEARTRFDALLRMFALGEDAHVLH